jgi:hypothetical protein
MGFLDTRWIRRITETIGVDNPNFANLNAPLADIKSRLDSNLPNLDTALSTRASETTLSSLRDRVESNLPNLDVALSTRASEATLGDIKLRLPESLTPAGNLKIGILEDAVGIAKSGDISSLKAVGGETPRTLSNIYDQLASVLPRAITKVGDTTLSGRDWSLDFATLPERGLLELVAYTTTPLPANGTWTSSTEGALITGRLVGSCYSDQSGTLYIEQSPDGTHWDVVDSFSVTGGSGIGFSVEKVCPYARVRYVNGATAQSVFRLYVYRRLRIR